MAKGRIPKPQSLRKLRGKHRNPKDDWIEPSAPEGMPKKPKHLDEIAAQEWDELAPILSDMGVLTLADRHALELYCQAYSRYRKAEAMIQKHGEIIISPKNKYPMVSPYVSVMNKSLDQARKFLIELGLTPAARARMRVEPKEKDEGNIISFISKRSA